MNPEDIPQTLRDIADLLEQLIGGGQAGGAAAQAPVNLEAMAAQPQQGGQA